MSRIPAPAATLPAAPAGIVDHTPITRADVEALLVDEAELLDQWDLQPWLALMEDDVRYLVPALDAPYADFRSTLFMICDDLRMLRSRVRQLQGKSAWAENPLSRTRRLVSNFRVVTQHEGQAIVTANFAVWRYHQERTDCYVGQYRHLLVRRPEGLRFRERRAMLDMEALRPHGKLSFIL